MAGNKNSGRRKKSENGKSKTILKKKINLNSKNNEKMQVIENTKELKSAENQKMPDLEPMEPPKMVEKNDDFDEIGATIAAQSAAALEAEKNQIKIKENAPENNPASSPAATLDTPPVSDLPQDEGWKEVAALGYMIAGEFIETKTGMKELNYSEDEIEMLSEHTDKVIKVLWPNATGGLTEEQKILLFSGSMIFKVHMQKYSFYLKAKELELEKIRLQNEKPTNSGDKKPA